MICYIPEFEPLVEVINLVLHFKLRQLGGSAQWRGSRVYRGTMLLYFGSIPCRTPQYGTLSM